ncbi:hypothetical protein HYV85_02960, partial [Candidatus Woesearchaeota archaeon]|nr:hypothetical protein [Candidatus Woesearchaeota archaeon]
MKRLSKFVWTWTAVCIVISIALLSAAAFAQQISYESAAVGRIVGESPDEMKQQLEAQDLQLDYASYFGDNSVTSVRDAERAKGIISVLEKKFNDGVDAHFVESLTLGRWSWDDVAESLGKWKKGSLLVVEAHGNVEGGVAKADSPGYLDGSLTPLNLDWSLKGKALVVFDSDFAGSYLPKVSSFVEALNNNAAFIAPTAVPDKEFVRVFMCNLGKYKTLGETYRESRNNYYWQTNRPSGIALMSYELYGNPTASVSVPSYDEGQLKELCKDFLKNYTGTATSTSTTAISGLKEGFMAVSESSQASAQQQYTRESSLVINDYSVIDAGEHSFLVANKTTLSEQEGELMLPKAVIIEEFPPKTVVTAVRIIAFDDPVDVKVESLPMWYGEPVKRECVSESSEASIDFSNSFTGSEEIVTVAISPVEVVNCSEGKLKLYTKVVYAIDYIPFSPVMIKEAAVPAEAFPGQSLAANVLLQNLQGTAFEGELVLSSMNGSGLKEHLAEKKVAFAAEQQEATAELAFAAPENKGISSYKLEFVQDGEAKTFREFSISVKALELSFNLPATAGESGEAALLIQNKLSSPVDAIISTYLLKGEETVTATQEKTLQPGSNEVKLGYEGLKKEDASYSLIAAVNYGSSKETSAATLVTNHPPLLEPLADVVVMEGGKIVLSPIAADIDGDEIQITYTGKMESSEWQTKVGDAGSYETTITATDGLLYNSQTVKITILEDKDVDKDGFEKGVDCNDNDPSINPAATETCNNIDDNCDSQTDENLEKVELCGYCGTTTTACGNGKWLANTTCKNQGPCSPSTEETQSCGFGGKQSRQCNSTCGWTQWSQCGNQGECQAEEKQEQKCGTTDIGTCKLGTQSRTCKNDYYWGMWSECSGNTEPTAESCNGLDDNCNGETDEELQDANSDGKCDSPPVLSPIGNRTVKENETLSIALAAYDFNGDKLVFSSSQPPKGATLADGVFSWTPTFSQAGSYPIEFAASDGLLQDKEQITITVVNANRPPEAKIMLEPAGQAGSYVNEGDFKTLKANASDPDGDDLYYNWWYLGNADWWQEGKAKLVSKSSVYYYFPNYT